MCGSASTRGTSRDPRSRLPANGRCPPPPILMNALKEHRLASKHRNGFVFPTGRAGRNITERRRSRADPCLDLCGDRYADGSAKYTGLAHSLRHFYAELVHQFPRGWGPGASAKAAQGRLRAFVDRDDARHIWALVSRAATMALGTGGGSRKVSFGICCDMDATWQKKHELKQGDHGELC